MGASPRAATTGEHAYLAMSAFSTAPESKLRIARHNRYMHSDGTPREFDWKSFDLDKFFEKANLAGELMRDSETKSE